MESLVAAGTWTRDVVLFDTRVGQSEVSLYKTHLGAVLALSMFGNFIASASEDHSVALWDRRAEKVLKQLNLYANRVRVL
jgi:WD40 repeat protein